MADGELCNLLTCRTHLQFVGLIFLALIHRTSKWRNKHQLEPQGYSYNGTTVFLPTIR